MTKRLTVLFFALLLFAAFPAAAYAAGEGSIQIDLRGGGKPIRGAQIRVYLAGTPVENGYRLTDTFGGGLITQLDVFSPDLAQWLSQRAAGGWRGTTGKDGSVLFEGLEEGLYLVTQTGAKGGYAPFSPFLVMIPWDGDQWQIIAAPKTEREITVVPDTSDPGTVERGTAGMLLSAAGLLFLFATRKKWLA